jgi:hypothetical protein
MSSRRILVNGNLFKFKCSFDFIVDNVIEFWQLVLRVLLAVLAVLATIEAAPHRRSPRPRRHLEAILSGLLGTQYGYGISCFDYFNLIPLGLFLLIFLN